jgi:uncharacterized protein (TIGR00255 family)
MIVSMTGFGRAEGVFEKKKYVVEARSVNNRFCEISFKYPKNLLTKDFELKEIVKKKISRGKVNVSISFDTEEDGIVSLNADEKLIKEYYGLLKKVNELIGSKDEIKIEHILNFTDLFMTETGKEVSGDEFDFICMLVNKAIDDLNKMKIREGDSLRKDIISRIKFIDKQSAEISKLSKERVKEERKKILKRVENLLNDKKIVDEGRLELEVILLADKIDITEEVIRLKSHTKYFLDYSKSDEFAGRRLNFLIQEINREINTVASKSMDAEISQMSVRMKEELEKIREQLQNVE